MSGAVRGPSSLDRRLVAAAVTLSPEAHRDVRREQWLADLAGAADLGMNGTVLAFGALTTALFHRRSSRRSTWETSPGGARTPRAVRASTALIVLGFLSMVAGIAAKGLLQRHDTGTYAASGVWVVTALVAGIPAILYALAVYLSSRSRRLRRLLAGLAVFPTALLFAGYLLGAFRAVLGLSDWMIEGPVVGLTMAIWFVARAYRGSTWTLLLFPLSVFVAAYLLRDVPLQANLSNTAATIAAWSLIFAPFAACTVAGIAADRLTSRGELAAEA